MVRRWIGSSVTTATTTLAQPSEPADASRTPSPWRRTEGKSNHNHPPKIDTTLSPLRPRTRSYEQRSPLRSMHEPMTTHTSTTTTNTLATTLEPHATVAAVLPCDNDDMVPVPRHRLHSRDIPRSYSGLYAEQDDGYMPLQVHKQQADDTWKKRHFFCVLYCMVVAILQIAIWTFLSTDAPAIIPPQTTTTQASVWTLIRTSSWTCTNLLHLAITLLYIHWIKGTIMDDPQGEMNALTFWEQLEATPNTGPIRQFLILVPTLLCYVACQTGQYEPTLCIINVVVWLVAILAKLPMMNGVRLFGINRTAGIDDLDDENKQGRVRKLD